MKVLAEQAGAGGDCDRVAKGVVSHIESPDPAAGSDRGD